MSFFKKVFILVTTLLSTELFLQAVGFFLNSKIINDTYNDNLKTTTILCLGESTTEGGYPKFLQNFLNQSTNSGNFQIINKGKSAINTAIVLKKLEENLTKYQPQIAVTMLGINDSISFIPKEKSLSKYLGHIKLYRLAKYLQDNIALIYKTYLLGLLTKNELELKILEIDSYLKKSKVTEALFILNHLLKKYPKNSHLWYKHGEVYFDHLGDTQTSIKSFEKSLSFNPKKKQANFNIGVIYAHIGNSIKSIPYFHNELSINPRACADVHIALAKIGLHKIYEINTEYHIQEFFKCNTKDLRIYPIIVNYYKKNNQIDKAANYLEKAPSEFKSLSVFQNYKTILLSKTSKNLNLIEDLKFAINPWTQKNYNKIVDRLITRGVRVYALQYPGRGIELLKKTLNYRKDVIYIDSKVHFDKLLETKTFDEVYTDFFGGNFGHMTELGKSLLGKIVSESILKNEEN